MTSTAKITGLAATQVSEDRRPDRRSSWWTVAASAVVASASLTVFAPVLGTPYSADDVPNSGVPGYLRSHHISLWHYIVHYTSLWMHHYGRFFFGAVVETNVVFSTLTTRASYKTFQLFLLAVLVLAVGHWVRTSLRDWPAGLVAIAALTCCWQFRYPRFFDGITSFSGLLPWTMLLMVGAMLLLAKRPTRWAAVAFVGGVLLWSASVITYEITVLVSPAIIAALWLSETDGTWRRNAVIGFATPTLLIIGFDAWLQTRMIGPRLLPDFTIRFVPRLVLVTSIKQFVAALPLSQYWVPGSLAPPAHLGWLIVPVIALTILVTVALVRVWGCIRLIERRHVILLLAVGSWLWVVPALFTGATERWQNDVAWGEGYLPVVFETLGVALVVLALLCELRRLVSTRLRVPAKPVAYGLLTCIAFCLALTAALNFALI